MQGNIVSSRSVFIYDSSSRESCRGGYEGSLKDAHGGCSFSTIDKFSNSIAFVVGLWRGRRSIFLICERSFDIVLVGQSLTEECQARRYHYGKMLNSIALAGVLC